MSTLNNLERAIKHAIDQAIKDIVDDEMKGVNDRIKDRIADRLPKIAVEVETLVRLDYDDRKLTITLKNEIE